MRTFSRRDFLKLGVGTAGVTLLAACAPTPQTSTPSSPAQSGTPAQPAAAATGAAPKIKRGGTLVHSQSWTYPTLDVHLSSIPTGPAYSSLYDTLIRHELVDDKVGRYELKPGLAESWEQADPKTIVMKLRKGVKFHDGSDFNAEVAKWNLDRMRSDKKSFARDQTAAIDTVDVVDPYTIKLNLKAPSPAILAGLSGGSNGSATGMLSKVAMDKLGPDKFALNPVGTGPMKFKQMIPDDRVVLERFEDYWMKGADGKTLPYVDQFVSRYIPDPSVAMVELRSGGIHVIDNIPPKDVETVKSDPSLVYWEMPWAGPTYFFVGFNLKSGPFATNLKLRQAALYAIDRESMAKAIGFGIGRPALYPLWNSSHLGYDESIVKYPFDLDKAKQFLKDAGYPNGIDVNLLVIAREPENTIGQMAAEMWSKAGIKTKLETLERLSWIDRMQKFNFDSGFWRISTQPVDDDEKRRYFGTGGASNWSSVADPELDKLMEQGGTTYDVKQRAEYYKKALTLIQEKAYLGSGFQVPENKALRKEMKGSKVQFTYLDIRESWLDS